MGNTSKTLTCVCPDRAPNPRRGVHYKDYTLLQLNTAVEKVKEEICKGICNWCTLKVHKHITIQPAHLEGARWKHKCKTGERRWIEDCRATEIRQLDLTKLDEGGEEK